MATFQMFHDFGEDLGLKIHNLNTDTLTLALSNVAPVKATGSVIGDITQISNGNGYTASSHDLGGQSWAETSAGSGVWRLQSSDEVFTAFGGSIAQFRYIVLWNNTAASDQLIGYLDYGSAVDVTVGNTFTVDVGTNGWLELTIP